MVKKNFKTLGIALFLLLLIFWLPFIYIFVITQSNISKNIDEFIAADAAIIFGAHLTSDSNADSKE